MTPIRCEQCGRLLFTANPDGLLEHAGGLVREVHGVCACGHGYHWSVCERQLEKIQSKQIELEQMLKRYNQRKSEIDKELAKWMR